MSMLSKQKSSLRKLLLHTSPTLRHQATQLIEALDNQAVYNWLFSALQRDEWGLWSLAWNKIGHRSRKTQPLHMLSKPHQRTFRSIVDLLHQQWEKTPHPIAQEHNIDILMHSTHCWPPPLRKLFLTQLKPIPSGQFMLKLPKQRTRSKRSRQIILSRSFLMMEAPVTQYMFLAITGDNPSFFQHKKDCSIRPVEQVSWYDAIRFANLLSTRMGLKPCYHIEHQPLTQQLHGEGFRLPTRAEWSWAARGGDEAQYMGAMNPDAVAWTKENSRGETRPIKLRQANGYGLFDMGGNVHEWCWDWFKRSFRYGGKRKTPTVDPTGPTTAYTRSRRGGSWSSQAWEARWNFPHTGRDPAAADPRIGLRLMKIAA